MSLCIEAPRFLTRDCGVTPTEIKQRNKQNIIQFHTVTEFTTEKDVVHINTTYWNEEEIFNFRVEG